MISATLDELQRRADRIIAGVPAPGLMLERVETRSSVGGGALPGQEMPSVGLRLSPMSDSVSADHLARLLRTHQPVALFCRVQHDAVVIDLRTILPEDDATLIDICIEVADRL
jgi:L-seryl-tRNA(Ser) seleniumtransferase